MADWKKLLKEVLLSDGVIDAEETKLIEAELMDDGFIDEEELDFITELRNEASGCSSEFTKFFFTALASKILEDGAIDTDEATKLREILFADGVIDSDEKAFLLNLKSKAKSTSPEFEALYAECMK